MSLLSWLLFLHVLAAMVWLGGGAVVCLIGVGVRRSSDDQQIAHFAHILGRLGLRAFMPAVLVVLATGLWMAFGASGWSLSRGWVLLGLGLFLVAFGIGAVYLSRVATALEHAVAEPGGDAGRAAALVGRWLAGYGVVLLVLVAALWDMVFKPLL